MRSWAITIYDRIRQADWQDKWQIRGKFLHHGPFFKLGGRDTTRLRKDGESATGGPHEIRFETCPHSDVRGHFLFGRDRGWAADCEHLTQRKVLCVLSN